MKVERTRLPDVFVVYPDVHADARGWFYESFNAETFYEHTGLSPVFVQQNHVYSEHAGTLRGMHMQTAPHAQAKLVSCISGAIYDVVVDVREGSDTYGEWAGTVLNAAGSAQIYIPEGFLHGYVTLIGHTQVRYSVTDTYHPECCVTVRHNDPAFGIIWKEQAKYISDADRSAPDFAVK